MINPKTRIESTGEEKEMKNVEQNENSPVETIDKILKRLRANEIDGRKSVLKNVLEHG